MKQDKKPAAPDQKNEDIKTYYIRMAQPEDFDKIFDFYHDNKHPNIREREVQELRERADHGSIVMIEDEDGELVAASISFAHRVEENGIETVKWTEVGATRIAGINGYPGVFDLMVVAQTLRSYLVEPPEDCFIARMRYDKIQKTAERLGWRRMDDLGDLGDTLPDDRKDDWFRAGVEALPTMAQYMVDAWDKPTLTNPKTGEKIKISFERSTMFDKFKDSIEKLAERDYGSVDKPDLTQGIRKHRDDWLKRRFR